MKHSKESQGTSIGGRCPKGDECALNKGAVYCFACGRNWPPDETWEQEQRNRISAQKERSNDQRTTLVCRREAEVDVTRISGRVEALRIAKAKVKRGGGFRDNLVVAQALIDADALITQADELVSRIHDIVWASYPEWEGNEGRREPLNAAMWDLHKLLREGS